MQIGDVIRKYRKEKNITQEEMAGRLGVTAPAVNKWEKGVSQPDILLLAPIARLLGITLETLLSFNEEITQEEIAVVIKEIDEKFETECYEEVFRYAEEKIREYPNSARLLWQIAQVLEVRCIMDETVFPEIYEGQILEWFERALESDEGEIKRSAAGSLYAYYLRKEDYEAAERYIGFFSEESTERKRKQAEIYSRTNRTEEAYRTYEEILFSEYQMLNLVMHGVYMLSMQNAWPEQAKKWMDKISGLAKLFDMGTYYEESCKLELAVSGKNVEQTKSVVRAMLDSVEQIDSWSDSFMYAHMKFKKVDNSFYSQLKNNLVKCFQDKETFNYMEGDAEWQELIERTIVQH